MVRTRGVLEVHESKNTVRRGKIVSRIEVPSSGVICFIGSEEYLLMKSLTYSYEYDLSYGEDYGRKSLYARRKSEGKRVFKS